MQYLDRYLKSISQLLPAGRREDILRELSDDIQSEIEDKQSELGRSLNDAEQLEILKRRGTPLQVAAGFTQNKGVLAFGPQLIGPVLFPFYARVLIFNVGLTLVVLGSVFAGLSLSGQSIHVREFLSNIVLQIFLQLTAVTIVFALIERHFSRQPFAFDVKEFDKKLNENIQARIYRKIQTGTREVSRFDSMAILIASGVALLWIQSLWAKPFLVFGPAASQITFAPVWHRIYLPTIFIMLATIIRASINLARPDWVRFRDVAAVVFDLAGLAVVYTLMFGKIWVIPLDTSGAAQNAANFVNQWISIGLWVAAIIALAQTIASILRLYKNLRWSHPETR